MPSLVCRMEATPVHSSKSRISKAESYFKFWYQKAVCLRRFISKGLSKAKCPWVKYQEVSKFPSVRRDPAVVVDRSVSFVSVEDYSTEEQWENYWRSPSVRHLWKWKINLEPTKIHGNTVTFESTEKSLNSEEIDKLINRFESLTIRTTALCCDPQIDLLNEWMVYSGKGLPIGSSHCILFFGNFQCIGEMSYGFIGHDG